MNPHEKALAYYRTYQLLSQVMLGDFTDDTLAIIHQLPEFDALESRPSDDWKADHYALFGMNVYAFETVLLSDDGLLGGAVTEAVARSYYEAGYQPDVSETADHIGNQLGLMAFLSGAEADAHEDDVVQAIHHMTHLQRKFLDEHLLCWLPSLVIAIHRQGDEAFSIIADIMLDLAIQHRKSLDEDPMHPAQLLILPPAPLILDNDKTGLKDIAEFLLTPVYSGIYLSRDDITRLGTQFRLPRGFGKRQQMLTNLLRTAVDYDAMDDLMGAFQDEVTVWSDFLHRRVPDKRFSSAWITRLDETTQFLQTIREVM